MQVGIFAKTFDGQSPNVVFGKARAAGYQVVQYNMACSGLSPLPDGISAEAAETVASAAVECEIEITAISATYNMIHPDLVVRERGRESLRRIAERAGMIGTRLVTLCTGTRDPDDQWRYHPGNDEPSSFRDLMAEMAVVIGIAELNDVYLGVEPELSNVINSAERARRLIDTLASDRVKIVLDPANLFELEDVPRQREIVAKAIDLLADRIVIGHAKDRLRDGRFVTAGRGVLDYPHYVECLKTIGFTGPLIAHGLSAAEAPEVREFLRSIIEE